VSLPRVAIGIADGITLAGVAGLLNGHFEIVAETTAGPELLEAVRERRPPLAFVDAALGGDGIALVERICSETGGVACVVLASGGEDDDELIHALEAGALGYMPRDLDETALPLVLQRVLAGEAGLRRSDLRIVLERLRSRRAARTVQAKSGAVTELSAKEAEVLALLGEGHRTATVAARLGITPVTVRRHVSRAASRLGARDRDDAVRLYHETHTSGST
jgi:DNA-binding NarL/FixJ family response regulator